MIFIGLTLLQKQITLVVEKEDGKGAMQGTVEVRL